jgi:hypothetical protein
MDDDRVLALSWAREDASDEGNLETEAVVDRAYEYLFFLNGIEPLTDEELDDMDQEIADLEKHAVGEADAGEETSITLFVDTANADGQAIFEAVRHAVSILWGLPA